MLNLRDRASQHDHRAAAAPYPFPHRRAFPVGALRRHVPRPPTPTPWPAGPRRRLRLFRFHSGEHLLALSGYVLAYNHLDGRPVRLRPFWVARAARLLPAFLVSELLCVAVIVLSARHDHASLSYILRSTATEVGVSFGFLQGWLFPLAINMAAWSLSCEVFFYLVFPLFAVPFAQLSRRGLECLAGTLAAISLIAPLTYILLQPDGVPLRLLTERALTFPTDSPTAAALNNALWHTLNYRFYLFFPIVHLPVFLLGVALGRYRRVFLRPSNHNRVLRRNLLYLAFLVLLLLLCFSGPVPHILMHDSLAGVIACACLLFAESAPAPVRHLFETRTLLFLGEASYALYILQLPCAIFWEYLAEHLHRPALSHSLQGALCFVALVLVFSALVYKLIERPLRLRIRRFAYGVVPIG